MTDIIEAIDAWTTDRYGSDYTLKLFGLCELMTKTSGAAEQPMPVTMPNVTGERTQVSLDDKFNFITWMRWISPTAYRLNEDWSFGKSEARVGTIPVRLVIAYKNVIGNTLTGEDLVFDFVNAFPSKFSINNYQFVFASPELSIDPDHETIYRTELGNTVYEKHRFPWNLYVITINIEFMKCRDQDAEADFITDEFGNCLTA